MRLSLRRKRLKPGIARNAPSRVTVGEARRASPSTLRMETAICSAGCGVRAAVTSIESRVAGVGWPWSSEIVAAIATEKRREARERTEKDIAGMVEVEGGKTRLRRGSGKVRGRNRSRKTRCSFTEIYCKFAA